MYHNLGFKSFIVPVLQFADDVTCPEPRHVRDSFAYNSKLMFPQVWKLLKLALRGLAYRETPGCLLLTYLVYDTFQSPIAMSIERMHFLITSQECLSSVSSCMMYYVPMCDVNMMGTLFCTHVLGMLRDCFDSSTCLLRICQWMCHAFTAQAFSISSIISNK